MKEQLKALAFSQGAADLKVCEVDEKLAGPLIWPGHKRLWGIVVAFPLSGAILDQITDHPTKLYFHHYRTVNFALDQLALRIALRIQKAGYKAMPIPASQIVDWEKQTAHLSHKKLGELAGLGWLGRNNLLVHPKLGAQFRLVSLLTDMPLEADAPLRVSCGACKDCLDVCPAGAIKPAPQDFDHLACFEKLKEFRRAGFTDQFICGICVTACAARS